MAYYTTSERVRQALGGRDQSSLPKGIVDEAIRRATARVRSALGLARAQAVEALQTGADDNAKAASTPELPASIATDLAGHYCLVALYGANAQASEGVGMLLKDQGEAGLKGLQDGSTEIPEIGRQVRMQSSTQGYQPRFQADDPIYHRQDPTQAQDILDARGL